MSRHKTWDLPRPWLAPLVPFYAAGAALRSTGLRLGLERVERLAWPVISVGSLSAGGAGKTPFVIALAKLLKKEGQGVNVLSRGYGRRDSRVARVDPTGSVDAFGDEPLLMAQNAPADVYVGARRIQAGRLAEAAPPARIHLLDDGFQHRQLARDLDIALVSSADLQDWLLPAGNLRESWRALRRANVLAIESGDDTALEWLRTKQLGAAAGQSIWRFHRRMQIPALEGRVAAFCGIARPQQFFAGLTAAGLQIVARHAFRDHHRFQAADIQLLLDLAERTAASALVTTAKDRVRLGALQVKLPVQVAGLSLEFEDEPAVLTELNNLLRGRLARLGSEPLPG